jgi:predicted transposase YdaD
MKTDHSFYQLFQQFPESFFEMIGSASQAENYRFDAIEVKEVAFRMDGAFLPKDNAIDSPIYFIEVQFKKDLPNLRASTFRNLHLPTPPPSPTTVASSRHLPAAAKTSPKGKHNPILPYSTLS